jgi:hypothetical protein
MIFGMGISRVKAVNAGRAPSWRRLNDVTYDVTVLRLASRLFLRQDISHAESDRRRSG